MTRIPQYGYTLIELVIVVAIIGILAAVTSSFFGDNVQQARCTDGRNAVLRGSAVLEKCRAAYGVYDNANCDTASFTGNTADGYFNVSTPTLTPTTFTVSAAGIGTASAANGNTFCSTITIDHLGVQGGTGSSPW